MEKAGEAGDLVVIKALMPEMERQFGLLREAMNAKVCHSLPSFAPAAADEIRETASPVPARKKENERF